MRPELPETFFVLIVGTVMLLLLLAFLATVADAISQLWRKHRGRR